MTKASILIVSWNGEAYISRCLDAVLAQVRPGDEVIVVDNASADGTAGVVQTRYPQVRLLANTCNLGYAGGCNVGLQAAQGERLLLVNQDVVLVDGWLAALDEALADGTVGVVGCKLFYPGRQVIQHAGGILRWPRAVSNHWGHGQPDDGRWDTPRDVDYVTGAAWGFRRDLLVALGGLDEGYWPGYYEEVDYCFRARDRGRRVVYVPQAAAVHDESTTLGKGSPAYLEAFHRGRLRFALKHRTAEEILVGFVPAERAWLAGEAGRTERLVMGRVYRRVLLTVPSLYTAREACTPAVLGRLQAVTAALAGLQALVWGGLGHSLFRQTTR